MDDNIGIKTKYEELINYFKAFNKAAIAYSAGVDSTLLLYAANIALGSDRLLAITADTGAIPEREINEAREYCISLGIPHKIIKTNVFGLSGLMNNPKERCYICKKYLYGKFLENAKEKGVEILFEGSNADDYGVYRPGLKALKELEILSPYKELGYKKDEIRAISQMLDLPTFDKPSYPCLLTRFPYGEEITEYKLCRVDKAEQIMINLGFRNIRVRSQDDLARIEIDEADMEYFMTSNVRNKVNESFKRLGFSFVTLDIGGFRSGSYDQDLGE
ncbi:MAG: ATP-dependent sacrificial sulfur transferase LarE [Lachnospiraceae bacterium]|nr:ATP-dependent sacrificial sulfur transferase LarE [Lachnospiraceae bacterium]